MDWLLRFWRSTIGSKVVMAATGAALYGFVIVHMIGNLNVFLGREALNDYGAMLHAIPELLWAARLGLLTFLGLHILSFLRLAQLTAAARPVAYKKTTSRRATWYSRSMKVSGVIVLVYLVIHLLNLTVGAWHPGGTFEEQPGGHAPDAFHNLTTLLAVPSMGIFYVVANLLLGMHLWHGSFSLFKTLGMSGEKHLRLARAVSWALSTLVVVGNVSIALAILTGIVK